jgi:tetratricopeptide (TPR) repeat protein
MTRIPESDLADMLRLYGQGLYLQAHAIALRHGPMRAWEGTDARVLGGRLAMNLGAPRLARGLHSLAWRRDRAHPEATYYYAFGVAERRGALEAWEFARAHGDLPGASDGVRGDWLAIKARLAATFRDFDAAERLLQRADELSPAGAWVCVERSHVLEMEDRTEEALAAARRSLERRPWYRPGVQAVSHLLQLLDRDEEAAALLREASGRIESAYVYGALSELESERERPAEALAALARYEELTPLKEPDLVTWLAARRADLAYLSGDLAAAAAFATEAKQPEAELYAHPPADRRRVRLAVPFVRQHHLTCAPATLTAIARFWSMPAEHLQVVEAICYDGTPAHSERSWALKNGWRAREFTVTWESAVALLDRGVPFTLTTVAPGAGHLQAVVGYDSLRRTLLIRDPYRRHYDEFDVEKLLKQQRATGPRGMVLVPEAEAARLDGVALPDAEPYDRLSRVQGALLAHDRDAAAAEAEAIDSSHRLGLAARSSLASYDGNRAEQLAVAEKLLAMFPGDVPIQLMRLSLLRDLSRRDERLAELRRLCDASDAHPAFWPLLAHEQQKDGRRAAEAERLFRKSLRRRGLFGADLHGLAGIEWDRRDFGLSTEMYRLAACLEEREERLATSYFVATRHLRRTEEAVAFLERRFERFGRKSSAPVMTLFTALSQLDRMDRAFEALEQAMAWRPEDGELLLYACDAYGRNGRFDRARALLASAEGRSPRPMWLRTSADLAMYRGELAAALTGWQQVLEAEPLAVDAHRGVARLLAETKGPSAALAHVRAAAERFPHHAGIHQVWLDWVRDEDAAVAVEVARRLVAVDPSDGWARRELALQLSRAGAAKEAFAEAEAGRRLEPSNSYSHSVLGELHAHAGRIDQARAAFRLAVRMSVDNTFAIGALMDLAPGPEERRREVLFVRDELGRQATFGDGVLAWRDQARATLPGAELLETLEKVREQRPDLVQTWSAVVRTLLDLDRREDAKAWAARAAERFPLVPSAWRDLASACRATLDRDGEIEALEKALAINPSWGEAARALAAAHERAGWLTKARPVLEQAIARAPLDPANHGSLASLLWSMGERDAAVERARHAVLAEPGYERGWSLLRDWAAELKRPEIVEGLARDLAKRRPGEARSWMVVARALSREADLAERLTALDRAIELNPRLFEAHDFKATLLAEAGRFAESRVACRHAAWGGKPPVELRGREHWVAAREGDERAARAGMMELLAEHPRYAWGWQQVAAWSESLEDWPATRDASAKMAELSPQSPVAHGYLGDAKRRLNDRAGAKAAFRRAVDLAPDYTFAGLWLFDLHLEDMELEPAAEVLEVVRPHLELTNALARDVQLAARRLDEAAAMRSLARLLVEPGEERWPVDAALKAVDGAKWTARADEILEAALGGARVNSRLGFAWADRGCRAGRRKAVRARLETIEGTAWEQACAGYLEWATRERQGAAARELVRALGARLRGPTFTWGYAGYALYSLDFFGPAAEWFEGWRSREGLEAWMLTNLALTMRTLGRRPEASEASRRALELEKDHTTPLHRVMLAFDEAAGGEAKAARERLDRVEAGALEPFYRCLHAIASATADFHLKGDFAAAKRRLKEALGIFPTWRKERLLARAYRECVASVATAKGGIGALMWRLFARW